MALKYIDWGDVELIVGWMRNSSSFCYMLLVVVCVIFFFAELSSVFLFLLLPLQLTQVMEISQPKEGIINVNGLFVITITPLYNRHIV